MEPVTLMLLAGGALAYMMTRGKKADTTPQLGQGDGGFAAFPPGAQQPAWYAATSIAWTMSAQQKDKNGKTALVYRGNMASADNDSARTSNDKWFRASMGDKDLRLLVSDDIVIPKQGVPYLVMVPSGFEHDAIPAQWGTLLQLYAPAPGWLAPGGKPGGQPGQPGLPAEDAYSEIASLTTQQKVRALAANDDAALRDLDMTADLLEKQGYLQSAAALRQRRNELALQRQLAAQQAGGWLYIVRKDDLAINVAQWYGGEKPGVLAKLAKLNPKVSANNWAGWVPGAEVLLPNDWPDPSLRPLPPLASAKGPPENAPPGSGAAGGKTQPDPSWGSPPNKPGWYFPEPTGDPKQPIFWKPVPQGYPGAQPGGQQSSPWPKYEGVIENAAPSVQTEYAKGSS